MQTMMRLVMSLLPRRFLKRAKQFWKGAHKAITITLSHKVKMNKRKTVEKME